MTWFAVYEADTGILKSSGSVIADKLPAGWLAKEFAVRPDDKLWNPTTLDFDIDPPIPAQVWSAVDFMQRFTVAERIAIRIAQKTDPVVEDIFEMVKVAQTIRSDHSMVVQGLVYLQSVGLLTADRATEIGSV
jgi:hypothetical protein